MGSPVQWMVGLILDNPSPVQIQSKSSPRLIQQFPVKWPNAWHGHVQPVQQEKQPRQDKIDFFFSAWLSGCSSKALPESIFLSNPMRNIMMSPNCEQGILAVVGNYSG